MKNKKLKLEELEVTSFVTKLNKNSSATIEGGDTLLICSAVATVVSLVSVIGSIILTGAKDVGEDIRERRRQDSLQLPNSCPYSQEAPEACPKQQAVIGGGGTQMLA